MSVPPETVRYIARLAHLHFDEAEERQLADEMTRVLDYMAQLDALDTTDVPPMTHVLDLHNVTRPDEPVQRITRDDALAVAPEADDTFFRAPKVIG